jgi:hypothetical protein
MLIVITVVIRDLRKVNIVRTGWSPTIIITITRAARALLLDKEVLTGLVNEMYG